MLRSVDTYNLMCTKLDAECQTISASIQFGRFVFQDLQNRIRTTLFNTSTYPYILLQVPNAI